MENLFPYYEHGNRSECSLELESISRSRIEWRTSSTVKDSSLDIDLDLGGSRSEGKPLPPASCVSLTSPARSEVGGSVIRSEKLPLFLKIQDGGREVGPQNLTYLSNFT